MLQAICITDLYMSRFSLILTPLAFYNIQYDYTYFLKRNQEFWPELKVSLDHRILSTQSFFRVSYRLHNNLLIHYLALKNISKQVFLKSFQCLDETQLPSK